MKKNLSMSKSTLFRTILFVILLTMIIIDSLQKGVLDLNQEFSRGFLFGTLFAAGCVIE